MANKKFKLGMLVLALVFVLAVAGCKEEEEEDLYIHTWIFDNQSSVHVTIRCSDLRPSDFAISPKKQQTAQSKEERITINYSPSDKVSGDASTPGLFIFYDK